MAWRSTPRALTPPKRGYRHCARCERNRSERFFLPRGRVCSTCRKRRVQSTSRDQRLRDTYGITEDEFNQILEAQGGKCAITGIKPTRGHFDCDHDHTLERELLAAGVDPLAARRASVRGVLSRSANRRLLPAARDQVATLHRAIDYLTDPPARKVLGT